MGEGGRDVNWHGQELSVDLEHGSQGHVEPHSVNPTDTFSSECT